MEGEEAFCGGGDEREAFGKTKNSALDSSLKKRGGKSFVDYWGACRVSLRSRQSGIEPPFCEGAFFVPPKGGVVPYRLHTSPSVPPFSKRIEL